MRSWILLIGFFFFFSSLRSLAYCQNLREKDLPKVTKDETPLKAFQNSQRVSGEDAGRFVEFLLFGTVAAIIIAFLFIAYFYEQSEASKPSLNTTPLRKAGITRYRRETEEKPNRYEINDDQ
jgi:hypothetical protein